MNEAETTDRGEARSVLPPFSGFNAVGTDVHRAWLQGCYASEERFLQGNLTPGLTTHASCVGQRWPLTRFASLLAGLYW